MPSTSSSMLAVSTSSSSAHTHLLPSTTSVIPIVHSESQFPIPISSTTTSPINSLNTSVSSLSTETCLFPTTSNKFATLSTEIHSHQFPYLNLPLQHPIYRRADRSPKPSKLFRVIQRRSESHNVTDSFLLELFLQQLPPNVQSILASIQPLTAQKASEVADRILEVTPV
ncbi:hypothetical protein TNCV_2671051 [Trichonephila clavipes]|nr:hypothetical protein TNCV_2671051 [Trichonephila clavipes]